MINTLKILLALILISQSYAAFSASILQILPTRVVFEGNKRSADVFLKNRGDNDGEYRVSLRNQRMTPEGKFEIIEKGQGLPDELFADKMIRYAPRRVNISKDLSAEPQTIRLVLRKPRNLPDGEYRSHLLFTSIPSIEEAGTQESGMSFKATVEITIPLIIRQGELNAKISLSNANIRKNDKGIYILKVTLDREGTRSIYGDLEVLQTLNGEAQRISYMRGLAIYLPTTSRTIEVPINLPPDGLAAGAVTINFKENPTFGGDEQASLEVK